MTMNPGEEPVKATLQGLTDSIDATRAEIVQERLDRQSEQSVSARALRRSNRVVALGFGLLVAGFLVYALQSVRDQRQDERFRAEVEQREIERCESSNNSRAAIIDSDRAVADAIVAALAGITPPAPRTPDQQARFDQLVAQFQADVQAELAAGQGPLQPRDCSREALGSDG